MASGSTRHGSRRTWSSAFRVSGEVRSAGVDTRIAPCAGTLARAGRGARLGGTVRYVDSSVERVQARVSGWVEERFMLACNGFAVPLTRTEREGEYVGGVRFKAWSPPQSPASDGPGADAADLRHLRSLDWAQPGWPHPPRRPIQAGATTRASRSTPTKRRHGAGRASSRSATRRARCRSRPPYPSREHPRTLDLRRATEMRETGIRGQRPLDEMVDGRASSAPALARHPRPDLRVGQR